MRFQVNNCNAPSGFFTDATDKGFLDLYSILCKYPDKKYGATSLCEAAEKEFTGSASYYRGIIPVIKNCGFLNYDRGSEFVASEVLTDNGMVYIKTYQLIAALERGEGDYSETDREKAINKLKLIKEALIGEGLKLLLKDSSISYAESLALILGYLVKFGKINQSEFWFVLFNNDTKKYSDEEFIKIISDYRNNKIELEPIMLYTDKNTGEIKQGDIHHSSAYNAFISLLANAGWIKKARNYSSINMNYIDVIESVLE